MARSSSGEEAHCALVTERGGSHWRLFSTSHDRVTVTFASSFSLIAASRSSTKRSSGGAECHSAFLVRHVPDLARGI